MVLSKGNRSGVSRCGFVVRDLCFCKRLKWGEALQTQATVFMLRPLFFPTLDSFIFYFFYFLK